MIDYKLLEAFATVVQEGGFEKAATLMNLTQSAISQRVRLLEERAGKILLSRTSPPKPTDSGTLFIRHYLQVKLLEEGLSKGLSRSEATKHVRLAVGINADSLASWLLSAIAPLLEDGKVLIDLHVDDQEQTHKFLKEGIVVGCISDRAAVIQGCRVEYLGLMKYRLLARPDFIDKWFANGLNSTNIKDAPAVIFNRKDMLHYKFLDQVLEVKARPRAIHYVPAPEQYLQMISSGFACGMVPDWQSEALRENGELVEICDKAIEGVKLYWHCWNLDSDLLQDFSKQLVDEAKSLLS